MKINASLLFPGISIRKYSNPSNSINSRPHLRIDGLSNLAGESNEFASEMQIETGHMYGHSFNGRVDHTAFGNELFF